MINLNGAQVRSLVEVLRDNEDGDDVVITKRRGTVTVDFSVTTVSIDADGNWEEN